MTLTTIRNFLVITILFVCPALLGQAFFIAPDTLCINDSVVIENQSRDDGSYYWNFCSGNLAYTPSGENMGNMGSLNGPAFIDFAKDGENYFAFITNHTDATVTRYSYGNDFLSTPKAVNMGRLGGIIPAHVQGIQVVRGDDDNWYVFIVGGQREDSRMVRLDFGSSLANNSPVAVNLGNIGELDYPVDLYIDNVNGDWIGFTVNKNTNTIVRFVFSNGLDNPPDGENLGNPAGLKSPCGILPIRDEGHWYIFVSNNESHEISRLDFGSSLFDEPSGSTITDASIYYPFDLTIIRDCERIYGFVLNRFNDIVRLEFENGLENDPVVTPLGEIGGLYNPQGISDIFRVGDNLYAFVANIDNSTISRLYFEGCNNASPASSTERDPPVIHYNQTGTYNINLVIDEGTSQQENYCRDIVVVDSASVSLGNDTIVPAGNSVVLAPDTLYPQYEWSTGSTAQSIEVFEGGTYLLTITNKHGCQATDDIEVTLDIGIPNFFTPNGDGYNDTWSIPFLFSRPDTEIQVFDRFGNLLVSFEAGQGEWDGTVNGNELPIGTYWYVIAVPGMKKTYKGSVTIKR